MSVFRVYRELPLVVLLAATVGATVGAAVDPAAAQTPQGDPGTLPEAYRETQLDLRFERMTVGDGLEQGTVAQIYQDHLGFMWFTTQGGLHGYDGYETRVYKRSPFDSTSIASSWTNAILEARDGKLFVGTAGGGLNVLDRDTGRFTRYLHDPSDSTSIASDNILAVAEDGAGNIWAAAARGGISKLDRRTGQFTHFSTPDDEVVLSVIVDRDGTVWAGTMDHVIEIDPDSATIRNHRTSEESARPDMIDHIREFEEDPGILWVSTDNGFLRFDKRTATFERIRPDGVGPLEIDDIAQDPYDENTLWLATGGQGVAQYDKVTGAFRFFRNDPTDPNSVIDDNVWNLTVDRAGGVWVGTPYGVSRFNPASLPFHNLDANRGAFGLEQPSMPFGAMTDDSGNLWIASIDASDAWHLTRLNLTTGRSTVWPADSDESGWMWGRSVGVPYQDDAGFVWVGSDSTIARYDPNRGDWRRRTVPGVAWIVGMGSVQGSDDLWLATSLGLLRFDASAGQSTLADSSFAATLDFTGGGAFHHGDDGNLWIGTTDGLFRREPDGTYTRYDHDPRDTTTLASSYIADLAQRDEEPGTMWVATDSGIDRFDMTTGKVTKRLDRSTGLPDVTIYGIVVGDDGGLWFSTNNGIGYYNPNTDEYRNYGRENGLRELEYMPAVAQGTDGTLYFGHVRGMTIFHPDQLLHNAVAPDVAFTAFRVHNETVTPAPGSALEAPLNEAGTINLSASQNDFTFEFVGLHYGNPEKNEYAYKLDGWDEDWRYVGHLRSASYTSLPAGEYTFRVKAANADGVWNEQGRSINVVISPPWWQTWWAYAGMFLILASAVFGVDRLQRRRITKKEQERLRIREAELQADSELRRREDAERMSDIGRAITSTLSVERVIDTVYENVNELMDAAVFGIGVLVQNPPRIHFPASKEAGVTLPPFDHDANDMNRLSSWCLANRQDVVIGDYATEFSKYVGEHVPPVQGESPDSVLYLPLIHQDKAVGVITAQSFAKHAYSDYHVSVLKSLASYAAIALDNADAYRQLGATVQQLGDTVENLMSTQARLVQTEKLASLGEMAAGIAHEIKNPLNFVNNFAELIAELVDEVAEGQRNGDDLEPLLADLKGNAQQVVQHGKRADGIVRAMMQHASGGPGERIETDFNALVEEYIGLAYHSLRATDRDANVTLNKDFDPAVGKVSLVPQEIGRVVLNLLGNAFYVVRARSATERDDFVPTVSVATHRTGRNVELQVTDNGSGIPEDLKHRIFEPFFTTKPTGEGTGLGLSLSYEIVTAGHNGSITVDSELGRGTRFVVSLPASVDPVA